MAMMHGSPQHPEIHGTVSFYRACGGSLVVAELYQLPSAHDIFAMHIHSGAPMPAVTGNSSRPNIRSTPAIFRRC